MEIKTPGLKITALIGGLAAPFKLREV